MANTNRLRRRLLQIFPLLVLLLSSSSVFSAAPNLLENGDFSHVNDRIPTDWGLWPGAKSAKEGPDGRLCLKISSQEIQYSMANQYVPIDGRLVQRVRFTGNLRYKDVAQGKHSYDVVRAFIIWFDSKGKQIDGHHDTGFWVGTGDWQAFDKEFDVPLQTTRAQILLGLHNSSGNCDFSNLRLEVTQGKLDFDPKLSASTDTHGWWTYTSDDVPAAGTPIDVSYLLDKPAGKHGYLTSRDAHLFFEDGTRARFWGFDIMGAECFPDHKTADKLADRLMRMGVNILRVHHMDAPWADPDIFDDKYDDTRHLSPSSMDKLDYFLAQLKKRGIYIYLDWLVNRKFKKGDGVADYDDIDDGAKIVSHFDPKIIALEKEYMRQVLDHRNKYTGLRYADEPQIALSEVINEDSLFYENWYEKVPPRYLKQLQKLCRKYEPNADPAVHPFDAPTLRALYKIESGYYKDMRAYLKQLGLRCPTTGSNHWEDLGPGSLCDSETDYVDRHYYWDHPKVNFGWQQEFDNRPMLVSMDDTMPAKLARTKVAGKPMVVTEWCSCWINDHIAEGPLIGAATGCLQDWDVMIWFDISSARPSSAMENEFDIANKPHLFAQWAAASLMFLRRDLKPLRDVQQGQITRGELLAGKHLESALDLSNLTHERVEVSIVDKRTDEVKPVSSVKTSESFDADWNHDLGIYTVKTPRTLAVDGFFSQKIQDFGWVKIRLGSEFAALWITSLDGKALTESKHFLITTAARAVNTNMQFNAGRTHLENPGTIPILIEPVKAELTFSEDVIYKPLAQNGTPGKTSTGRAIELGGDKTFWYEVTRP